MKQHWFLSKLETSQIFRLTLEVLITIILLSWLPIIFQIIAGIILSVVCEIVFAKIIVRNMKNKFSHQSLPKTFNHLENR